jgi:hypothetical protein
MKSHSKLVQHLHPLLLHSPRNGRISTANVTSAGCRQPRTPSMISGAATSTEGRDRRRIRQTSNSAEIIINAALYFRSSHDPWTSG